MIPAGDAQRLLTSLPLAIVLLAPGQQIAAVNPAAEQFFGQGQRRLTGRPLLDVISFDEPRVIERLGESDAPISARDIGVSVLGGLIGQGQAVRRLDVTISPVIDQPGWQVLTLHDSTAAEGLGQAPGRGEEGALRAPDILAHEIKNPLAGIKGAAQLLARKVGEKERALTSLIADEVDRIATLIDQMQTLSRRTSDPVAPCNLHESVRRARAVLDAAGKGAGAGAIRIEEEFDPSLPMVMGSPDALVQVLINLLSNAREACREVRDPRIVVRTRYASGLQFHSLADGKLVRLPIELRVSDNGPGVEPGMREHIFEPFVTSKKSGQGLGLALVRKLVRDMHGRIAHERDEAGGWTHFRVHLPMATESGPRKKAQGA